MVADELINMVNKEPQIVYFQPIGMNPIYCEVGMISKDNPDYIYYLYEPCKVLKSEVKIIDRDNVMVCRKSRVFLVKNQKKVGVFAYFLQLIFLELRQN